MTGPRLDVHASLRPGHSLTPPSGALSVGFAVGISHAGATQAMRLRSLTASGLSPYGSTGSSRHHSTTSAGRAKVVDAAHGYRALAIKASHRVELVSRNGKDLTRDYPTIVAAVADLKTSDAVMVGEIVALDPEGRPSFQALQHRRTSGLALVYYAFDLLQVEHESLLRASLDQRRRRFETPRRRIARPAVGIPARVADTY
jgi:hypothetical protein